MAKTYADDRKILDNILSEWEKDSVVDKACPNETAAANSQLHAKYLRILANHTLNIDGAKEEYLDMLRLRTGYYDGALTKEELEKQGWTQYLGKSPKTIHTRKELLDSDPLLMEILKRKKVYEVIVETCQAIIKEIHGREFMIPAYMNWEMKIRQG